MTLKHLNLTKISPLGTYFLIRTDGQTREYMQYIIHRIQYVTSYIKITNFILYFQCKNIYDHYKTKFTGKILRKVQIFNM